MQSKCISFVLLGMVAAVLLVGCGGGGVAADTALTAAAALDQGVTAFDHGDFLAAHGSLDIALSTAGLNADQIVDARLKRSICLASAGDYDAAQLDIDYAAQGPCQPEQLLIAEAFLLAQQGDASGANAKLAQAKRLHPKARLPQAGLPNR